MWVEDLRRFLEKTLEKTKRERFVSFSFSDARKNLILRQIAIELPHQFRFCFSPLSALRIKNIVFFVRTLIVLSAIPGSGKSTWARKYQLEHENTFIVSSDEIRLEFFGAVNDFRNEKRVWDAFLNRINDYAETRRDVTVIADATNLQNKYRRMYAELTPKFEKHVLLRFDVPYDICLLQNQMREKQRIVPKDAMEKLLGEMEEPDAATLAFYNEYRIIRNFISKEAQRELKQKSALN